MTPYAKGSGAGQAPARRVPATPTIDDLPRLLRPATARAPGLRMRGAQATFGV